jgi:hypothetical protein
VFKSFSACLFSRSLTVAVAVSKRFLNIKVENAVSERDGFAAIVLTMFNVAPVDAAI